MNQLYYDINNFIEENNISHFNELIIPINSFSSNSIYNVSIFYLKNLNKYKMNCSCGEKFNIGKREKCKHINNILKSLYRDIDNSKNNIFKNFIVKNNDIDKPFPSLNNMYELLEKINKDIEEDDDIFTENLSMMQISY
jgi:hypothetical protein